MYTSLIRGARQKRQAQTVVDIKGFSLELQESGGLSVREKTSFISCTVESFPLAGVFNLNFFNPLRE